MKRSLFLSVSAAALLTVAPAWADNSTSTVKQGATGNSAVVKQDESVAASKSAIEQNNASTGGSNAANVEQRGAATGTTPMNDSTVRQTGTSDEATVEQESFAGIPAGSRNVSTIDQAGIAGGSSAVVRQYGHNASAVTQTGDGNVAQALQGNDTTPSPSQPVGGNQSDVSQDGGDQAYVSQNFDIPSTGTTNYGGNDSNVTQTAGNNLANVNQTGLSSISTVTQSGSATAYVKQNGDNEDSTVTQTAAGFASVSQSGGENRSRVTQSGASTALVTQTGTEVGYGLAPPNNDSTVDQSGNGAQATVAQNGELNGSSVIQRGTSSADVGQDGVYNRSTVTQEAAATGTAIVRQTGIPNSGGPGIGQGDNQSVITQNSGNAYANVNQTANNPTNGAPSNDSVVTQNGSSNTYVTQTGDNNRSGVIQTGNGGLTQVTQTTDDADSDVLQNGAGNSAYVAQDAAAQSDVEQGNATVSDGNYANVRQLAGSAGSYSGVRQNGNGNFVDVAQSAANNDSYVRIDGNNNQAYLTQDGANNAQRVRVIGRSDSGNGVATGNVAVSRQTASARDNWSNIAQQGDDNRAEVAMSGVGVRTTGRLADPNAREQNYRNAEEPEVDVWQVSDNNKAYVDQASDASRVTIYQGLEQTPVGGSSYPFAGGSNNYASVTQTAAADNSRADVIQGGSNNIGVVVQSGFDSQSYVNQLGTGNTTYVSQTTTGNDSSVVQYGNANYASVTQ